MNTMGKILVILLLPIALAVALLLIFDFATRTNWKRGYEELKVELAAARANADAQAAENKELRGKLKNAVAGLDSGITKNKSSIGDLQIAYDAAKKQADTLKKQAEQAILNHEQIVKANELLQGELAIQTKAVKDREQDLVVKEKEVAFYRTKAQAAENDAKAAIARSQGLLKLLQEKETQLAKLQQGGSGSGATTVSMRDPNYDNPPPVYVKGLIEKIDAQDRGLVQLTVGSDAGINVDNTLVVYRLSPRPEYLGKLRVVEVNAHQAFARLMPAAGQARSSPLQVGDEVASKLQIRP